MIQSAQIRAARALLGWNQEALAKAAKIGIATIRRIEGQKGTPMGHIATLISIQSAFERAGLHFLDNDGEGGIGVRYLSQKAKFR